MMYNHYIPGSNGIYKRHSIAQPITKVSENEVSEQAQTTDSPKQNVISNFGVTPDLGDLLLLCIAILLLVDAEENDYISILIAVAAFVFHL